VRNTQSPFLSKGSGLLAIMPFLMSLHMPFCRYAVQPLLRRVCCRVLLIVLVPDLIPINERRLSVDSISSRSVWLIHGTIVHVAMMLLMIGGRLLYLVVVSLLEVLVILVVSMSESWRCAMAAVSWPICRMRSLGGWFCGWLFIHGVLWCSVRLVLCSRSSQLSAAWGLLR